MAMTEKEEAEFPYTARAQRIERELNEFKAARRKELELEQAEIYRRKVASELPVILASGLVTVWCRNGNVCKEATHCGDLECPFKSEKSDIINGPSKCGQFQLTVGSQKWVGSKMIAGVGSVDIGKNYSIK